MTVTDQIKILDGKIKQNEVQHSLDRKAAKIFALFSGNLDRYEYLTGEDLDYKPSAKFFNKRLKEEEKKKNDF